MSGRSSPPSVGLASAQAAGSFLFYFLFRRQMSSAGALAGKRGPPVCRRRRPDSEINARLRRVWLPPEARSLGAMRGCGEETEGF